MSSAAKDDPRPEPPIRAIALRHDVASRNAPDVVAKGQGKLAENILKLARENDIPVREDADLVQLLAACDVGDEIPLELYTVVAELLAYLYQLNGELPERPRSA